MTRLLRERPGELARRFDHALRVAGADVAAAENLTDAFTTSIPSFSTPVLLTRVRAGVGAEPRGQSAPSDGPVLAVLYRGDLALPQGSVAYSLFRERTATSMSAGDLIS